MHVSTSFLNTSVWIHCHFSKGNIFCVFVLGDETLKLEVYPERVDLLLGAYSVLKELTPIKNKANMKMTELLPTLNGKQPTHTLITKNYICQGTTNAQIGWWGGVGGGGGGLS